MRREMGEGAVYRDRVGEGVVAEVPGEETDWNGGEGGLGWGGEGCEDEGWEEY